jgi:hypothetical protein
MSSERESGVVQEALTYSVNAGWIDYEFPIHNTSL